MTFEASEVISGVSKLIFHIQKVISEASKLIFETSKLISETSKVISEASKVTSQTPKMSSEPTFHPIQTMKKPQLTPMPFPKLVWSQSWPKNGLVAGAGGVTVAPAMKMQPA